MANAAITSSLPQDLSFDEKLEKIQRYLPNGLTDKILAQRGKIEGERKQVTVMFCDMEGFTPLSEKLDPEKVNSIMDEVYEFLIHRVNEYGGTVNDGWSFQMLRFENMFSCVFCNVFISPNSY